MKYAQELYESGYITYMRTDSKKYSSEFIEKTKQYIDSIYGKEFISQNIDLLAGDLKNETKNAKESLTQEAHEAIRPVSINTTSVTEPSAKAQKLYSLIWTRTIESCMASAQYNTITAKINLEPPHKSQGEFSYKTEQVTFAGWQIVKTKLPEAKEYQYFLVMKKTDKGLLVIPKKIDSKFNLINLKPHYTEARLVQLLEEKGIGRPSTFASLIDKLLEREYVKKQNIEGQKIEGEDFLLNIDQKTIQTIPIKREFGNENNKLVIQPLGIIVIEFLLKHFESFFNYEYTREMEHALDLIACNKLTLTELCNTCYKTLLSITKDLKNETKFSLKIDDIHTLIIGKYGPVIKRQQKKDKDVTFIPVKKDLDITHAHLLKLEDMIDPITKVNGLIGKFKGEDLYIKKGKYGLYAQWTKDGKQETQNLKELEGKTVEQVEYLDVLRILEKDTTLDPERPVGFIRELSSTLSIRTGKFGDYIFYKKPRVKTPQFFKLKEFVSDSTISGSNKSLDARKCDKAVLLNWIKLTYNVE
jgi:DNA topoisomerase-1